ncbi:MAG: phosphopantothenoylcysteine decarboxylase, partial [Microcystaceae cyanobacterium]
IESLVYTKGKRDLQEKNLLITTGGTREYLDPVRFLGNPATGKMGLALAQAALDRGAKVTLIHGPLTDSLPQSERLKAIAITNAEQMEKVLKIEFPVCDWLIMAAAVADVKPAHYSTVKLPKSELPSALQLIPVSDLVAQLTPQKKPHQLVIGFAAQTGDIITPAKEKLTRKGLDWIVANPIDLPASGFGSETNQAVIINKKGEMTDISRCSKLELAHRLYDLVA